MDNPHRHASSPPERHQLHCLDETRTVQSEAESCEINNIMAKYEKTGLIDHIKEGGRYEDLPEGVEYQDALNMVIEAQTSFDGLPAHIRKEFDNDPAKFLSFVENPDNIEALTKMGLAKTKITAGKPLDDAIASTAAAEGDATKSSPESETKEVN